ncbi:MAG: DEAD/DEAH box helicase [Saprospiraceae bacterium]|nr:MAG: DEAD/DEAH box helicase [Saprospiraceae bacterium]
MRFDMLGFEPQILEGLEAMGFTETTPVQEQAIPAALQGRDILACAQTGTGKTAAFLLPILNKLIKDPIEGIDTLIIEPTRELAIQVDQQLEGFSYFTGVSSVAVYGGTDGHSMSREMKALKTGVDIVVTTPGRFLSHLQLGYVDLSTVRHLVLDEADRMLDMGFVTDIMTMVNKTPKTRQTLLFSATMPAHIRKFAQNILNNPLEVSIAISKPAAGITQAAYLVNDGQKNSLIEYLLRRQNGKQRRILIFASSKKNTKDLAAFLSRHGYPAADIHSDLDQQQREDTLQAFRNNSVPILVATDVLSRGIDIRGIDVVINYDVPGDPEDYVHRIGRTARADETGLALTLVTRVTKRKFDNIEKLTGMKVAILPLPPGIEDVPDSRGQGRRGGGAGRRPSRQGGRAGGGRQGGGTNHRGGSRQGRSDTKGR